MLRSFLHLKEFYTIALELSDSDKRDARGRRGSDTDFGGSFFILKSIDFGV